MNEAYIRKYEPDTHRRIKEIFGDTYPFMEEMYLFQHAMDRPPVCKVCGKPVKFRNINLGYQTFCSVSCSNADPDKISKTKGTCMERYGGVAPACSQEVSRKAVDTARQNGYDFRGRTGPLSPETKERMRETCMKRYSTDNVMHLPEFKAKVASSIDYDDVARKSRNSWRRKELLKHPDIKDINYDEYTYTIICPHPECTLCQEKYFIIPIPRYRDRIRDHTEICTRLLPVGDAGIKDTYPEMFVGNILDEYNITYETNNRSILNGKELDIYLPDHNLAIECNGIYWHSDNNIFPHNKMRHYEKWELCKTKGIQLLTIWEDQIFNNPSGVKNMVLAKLGIYDHRIYARSCEIVTGHDDIEGFLNRNHIQGSCRFSESYSLAYKGNLVCTMCFSPKKYRVGMGSGSNDSCWELVRFCTESGYQVVGGASRLLSHFRRIHPDDDIISFASHDISDGDIYRKLGFEEASQVDASYWYIDARTFKRYHRFSFTKGSLVKKGYDPGLTEFEIMDSLPYYRIYDSGQTKYILRRN